MRREDAPIILERLRPGESIDAMMLRLVDGMTDDAFGVAIISHRAGVLTRVTVARDQLGQEIAELIGLRDRAAKDQTAVLVNDEERDWPHAIAAMDVTVETVDEDREGGLFEPLKLARVADLLIE
jgi:hypothetical protein